MKKPGGGAGGVSRAQRLVQKELEDIKALETFGNVNMDVNPRDLSHMTAKLRVKNKKSFWFGATYEFSITIPDEYKDKPPKVLCKTKIYHPNIGTDGSVCLDIIKTAWRPVMDVPMVIMGLLSLFDEPNPNNPLNLEASKVLRTNEAQFRRNVESSLRGGTLDGVTYDRLV